MKAIRALLSILAILFIFSMVQITHAHIDTSNQIQIYSGALPALPGIPTIQTTDSRFVVSGVMQVGGRTIVAGILVPPGTTLDETTARQRLLNLFAQTTALLSPAPRSVTAPSVYLPVLSRKDYGYIWNSEPVITMEYYACPYGVYVDTVLGQQVYPQPDDRRYSYWAIHFKQQIQSGEQACLSNTWRSTRVWNSVRASLGTVYEYGPTTTSGVSEVPVSVSFTPGKKSLTWGLGLGWSFSAEDVRIIDHSDLSSDDLNWQFDILWGSYASRYTYTSEPGFSFQQLRPYRPFLSRGVNVAWKNLTYTKLFNDRWDIQY